MQQTAAKLWNRNFSLLMTVQILALFVNTTLSFVLPLHILYISGSPALFGTVLALAGIPLILMTPLGGIIADRGKKKRIIFWMDASTTIIIVLYMLLSGFFADVVPIVIVKLLALNVIQGIYMPTAMASVRFLVPKEKLVPANAAASMIFSLANATGPAIGTILYAQFNLFPVLA
ncbi:MAG: MFS transporter, partial [Treponema sp.]|nr:MFS transporter [Treponema sp.]